MTEKKLYYEHSGTVGALGPLMVALLGLSAAVLTGAIYGYALNYIPFIYLNFILTLVFGAAVGYAVGKGAKFGKIRSAKFTGLFGLVAGLLALYVSWVSWIHAWSGQEILASSFGETTDIMAAIAEEGAWSIFGMTPSGIGLYAIWAIEAVIIVGLASMVAAGSIATTPFCEACNCWVNKLKTVSGLTVVEDHGEMISQLEAADFSSLEALKTDGSEQQFTKVDLLHCPGCNDFHSLTLTAVTVIVDEDGDTNEDEEEIVENLLITAEDHKLLSGAWS